MCKNVIFSLIVNCDTIPSNVNLFVEGKDPIEMKLVQGSKGKTLTYEIALPIDSLINRYPSKIFYNYIINEILVYENNQQLLIAKQPLANNIYVNDTTKYKDVSPQITIVFHIKPPLSNKKQKVIYLKADSPVFVENAAITDTIQMQLENEYYFGIGYINVYLNQPIVYKYYINDQNGNELLREKGRMHTVYIHSAVPNKIISIYDIWIGSIPYQNLYPQVIVPHQTPTSLSTVTFEYSTPERNVKTVAIAGTNNFFNKSELFFSEDCWRRVFQIPREDVICKYSIGTSLNEGAASIDWKNAYSGSITKQSDFISSRILFEPYTFKKSVGIFIPLVSIRENPSQPVGDFKTLVSLAKWCNSVRINCIHVHIEHIHHGFLDPIHANGISWPDEEESDGINGFKSIYKFRKVTANKPANKNQNFDPMNCSFHASHHGGLLLPEVRDAKIKVLYQRFVKWCESDIDKNDFQIFLQCNEYIAKNCNGLFEQWIQFTLFNQLQNAFEQIFETGVQLITDVTVPSNIQSNQNNNINNNNNSFLNQNYNNDNNDNNNNNNANNYMNQNSNSNNNDNINDDDDDDDDGKLKNTNESGPVTKELDLISQIRIASHYSHALMIIGLCPHLKSLRHSQSQRKNSFQSQRLTIDFVRNLFGDIAQNVIDTFFRVSSFSVSLLDSAYVPKSVHSFASKLNSDIRDEFEKNMQMVINIDKKNSKEKDDDSEDVFVLNNFQSEVVNQLSSLAPNLPSALILDQMSCEVLTPEAVEKMSILPYSSIPIPVSDQKSMQCLGPMFLSPEMVSEFPSDMQAEIITDVIKQRIKSKEQYVEFYFTDLLRALGYHTDIEPIQTIKNNCRFLLQFTIRDLFRESETSEKIRAILSSPDRGMD